MAFKEAIKSLPLEEDNDFQQECEIMALAERGSIERAEIDVVLKAFILKLRVDCIMRHGYFEEYLHRIGAEVQGLP